MKRNEKDLKEKIEFLESELVGSLSKKTSNSIEIDVAKYIRNIADMKQQLISLTNL